MKSFETKDLIEELDRRGLGVFNKKYPFIYSPHAKDQSTDRKHFNFERPEL